VKVVVSEQSAWLSVLRRYIVLIALGNLAWEFAHMPLYTLWETGTAGEIVFAAIHCTGGDILIALSALMVALCLAGTSRWPESGFLRVGAMTITVGLVYSVFSEWLNIDVRRAWAYRDLMPIIPVIGVGLSPFLQWIVLPGLAFWLANPRRARR
jgi:hypothetical protein